MRIAPHTHTRLLPDPLFRTLFCLPPPSPVPLFRPLPLLSRPHLPPPFVCPPRLKPKRSVFASPCVYRAEPDRRGVCHPSQINLLRAISCCGLSLTCIARVGADSAMLAAGPIPGPFRPGQYCPARPEPARPARPARSREEGRKEGRGTGREEGREGGREGGRERV